MSKSGQNNFKGINFQVWTALSLFLQFLKKPEFSHIQLEGSDLEDFTLYFNDGTKIIGEAKVRSEKVQPALLKNILKNIITKKSFVTGDKILVICTDVSDDLVSNIKYVKDFEQAREKFRKDFKFPEEYISLLEYVDFWVIKPELNSEFVKNLIPDIIDVWLPDEEVQKITFNLAQKFTQLSEAGGIYYRTDLLAEIKNLKEKVTSDASYYNPLYDKTEKQYDDLEKALRGKSAKNKKLAQSAVKALSANFGLLSFAKRSLENKKIDNLRNWDILWQMNRLRYFGYGIFDIFKKNTHTEKNRSYIVEYCKKYSRDIRGFFQDDYFTHSVTDTLEQVLELSSLKEKQQYFEDVFFIISELLKTKLNDVIYIKKSKYDGHDKWEKQEISKLLKKVYDQAEKNLKKKIVNLIWENFSLIEDEDELSRDVPAEMYSIIKDWLNLDFPKKLNVFIKKINNQYHQSYGQLTKRGKKIYAGWEHIGGGTAFWGSNYHVGDRFFVTNILQPVIQEYYSKNPEKWWKFIKANFIASENKVNENKPDFLNRSVYEIVIQRYTDPDTKISDEAFEILNELLLQRRGIPHKSELIYQKVARVGQTISSEKKMNLVKVTLDKYKVPVSPFVEEIVRSLALEGNEEAQKEIFSWFSNEKYHERGRMGGSVGVSTINQLIDKDLSIGVSLLEKFISSDYFTKDKFDLFETYEVARIINKVIKLDIQKGIYILNNLRENKNWGRNQRSLFCFGLFNHADRNFFNNETYKMVYAHVVDPFLNSHDNNSEKICGIIPEGGFRAAIVQFADALATAPNCYMKEAIRIVSVFVDDPDPYLPGENPDREDDKYNEHKKIVETGDDNPSITTVRGWCGWTLMKCAVTEGRSEIDNIISLVSRLVEDKNYYVIHMACFALSQLGRISLTYTDESKRELFLDPDPKNALEKAKKIEKMGFELMERILKFPEENARKVLGKSVLRVFDGIRALNQKDAEKFLRLVEKFPTEVRADAAPFFLYYALFRKESYKKFKFRFPNLYDDIDSQEYDESVFEEILQKNIKALQTDNPDNCFKIISQLESILNENKGDKNIEQKIYNILLLIANKYGHHLFGLLHRIVIGMFQKSHLGFEKWFSLLKSTFESELEFYRIKGLLVGKDKMPPDATQYYWYPSLWNREILAKTLQYGGEDKFMEIMEIIFSFPLNFELYIEGEPIEVLKRLSAKNKNAKKLLKKLYSFDPGKWRELKAYVK